MCTNLQIARVWYSATNLQLRWGRREQSSSLSAQIEVGAEDVPPRLGGLVSLVWQEQVLFGGILIQSQLQRVYPTRAYQIQCVGFERFLSKKLIRSLSSRDLNSEGLIYPAAASAIISAAGAADYLSLDLREVSTPEPQAFEVQGVAGAAALSALAAQFGYDWRVEPALPPDQEQINPALPIGRVVFWQTGALGTAPVAEILPDSYCRRTIENLQSRIAARSITRVTVARSLTEAQREEATDPHTTVRRIQIAANSQEREFPLLPSTDRLGGAVVET